jgi:hypothetical protein
MATINTTDPKPGYVYDVDTDTWYPLVGIAPGSSVVRWRKTAAGGETSFTGLDDLGATLSYNAGTEQVYLNGVLLVRTEDYTATNGTSVTALNALAASDVIEVISFNATNVQVTDALLRTDINAKGDLIVGAGVDTAAILASGTNGQVLKVNTATTSGLEWGSVDADIEGVTAGTGISGGGTSGTVTITNSMATAIDAKGDLVAGTGADAFARLAVGTNGQVLTAASGEATGLSWATPVLGSMTLLGSGTLTGSSVTTSSISQSYKDLRLVIKNTFNTGNSATRVRVNSSSSQNYGYRYFSSGGSSILGGNNEASWRVGGYSTEVKQYMMFQILDYTSTTTHKVGSFFVANSSSAGGNADMGVISYDISTPAAITTFTMFPETGNFSGGTYEIYGVN